MTDSAVDARARATPSQLWVGRDVRRRRQKRAAGARGAKPRRSRHNPRRIEQKGWPDAIRFSTPRTRHFDCAKGAAGDVVGSTRRRQAEAGEACKVREFRDHVRGESAGVHLGVRGQIYVRGHGGADTGARGQGGLEEWVRRGGCNQPPPLPQASQAAAPVLCKSAASRGDSADSCRGGARRASRSSGASVAPSSPPPFPPEPSPSDADADAASWNVRCAPEDDAGGNGAASTSRESQ